MKIGGEILRRALGMLSSPGEVKGSSDLMTRESSWREKGCPGKKPKGQEREGQGKRWGEGERRGGQRCERRRN